MLCFPFWLLLNLTVGLWSRFWICFAQYQIKDQTNLLIRGIVLFLMVKKAKECSLLSPHTLCRTEVRQSEDKVVLLWQNALFHLFYLIMNELDDDRWLKGAVTISGCCSCDEQDAQGSGGGSVDMTYTPQRDTVQASGTAQEPVCAGMSQKVQENGATGFEACTGTDIWGTAVKNHWSTSFGDVSVGHSLMWKKKKKKHHKKITWMFKNNSGQKLLLGGGVGSRDLGWWPDAGTKCFSFCRCFWSEESAEGLKGGDVAGKAGLWGGVCSAGYNLWGVYFMARGEQSWHAGRLGHFQSVSRGWKVIPRDMYKNKQ